MRLALSLVALLSVWSREASGQHIARAAYAPEVGSRVAYALTLQEPSCKQRGLAKVGSYAATYLGGVLVGAVLWTALDDPEGSDRRVKGDAGYTPNANTALAIGTWIGATGAGYLTQPHGAGCGTFKRAALGAAIPTLPMLFMRNEPYLPLMQVAVFGHLQALGVLLAMPR